jgi:RNA polymerase sigma-70 factor, ECF subfamily
VAPALLDTSVVSVNSLLQRARAAMPAARPAADPSAQERAVLRRYVDAFERVDVDGVVALLREGARATMPPYPHWHDGRAAIAAALAESLPPGSPSYIGHLRLVPAGANLQPAAAGYVLEPGDSAYRPFAFAVLRTEGGAITDVTAFGPTVFPALGLAPALPIQEVPR